MYFHFSRHNLLPSIAFQAFLQQALATFFTPCSVEVFPDMSSYVFASHDVLHGKLQLFVEQHSDMHVQCSG